MTDVNDNTEKGAENELKKLSDNFYKAGRQRLRTLILAIVSLTVSALSSFSSSRALNAFAQLMSLALLLYTFRRGLNADTDLISIFHDAALLNLKRGVTVKALGSSDEQTSTPSRQHGSTLSNRLAKLTRDPYSIVRMALFSYIIEFIGLFNVALNLIIRVLGLSAQLQPLLSTFSMIVPISASTLLGLSQWSVSTAVRGSLESSCTSVWLKTLKEVRASLFWIFMTILLIYVFSFYLIPLSLIPSTRASYILLANSLYFGFGLGLLAFLAFLLMLLTLFRDVIYLVCSREQTQENRG